MTQFNLTSANALSHPLTLDQLAKDAPAAFANGPFERTSPSYAFISTAQLVSALIDAGFSPMQARQTRSQGERGQYARHMIRFRHVRESVTLVDAVPELVLINSHDASSAYQLRAGLYRPVCTNGLITRIGDFDVIHVPHRGNVIANVVDGAIKISRQFASIGDVVQQMANRELQYDDRQVSAQRALSARYREGLHVPVDASELLTCRRAQDAGNSLWHVYNRVQENLIRGGLHGRSAKGRSIHTRGIKAIREDVRINTELWQLAMNMIRR